MTTIAQTHNHASEQTRQRAEVPKISPENDKYRFTGRSALVEGKVLWEIVATKNFTIFPGNDKTGHGVQIKKGDKGGFLEDESQLDFRTNAWVGEKVGVIGEFAVTGDRTLVKAGYEDMASAQRVDGSNSNSSRTKRRYISMATMVTDAPDAKTELVSHHRLIGLLRSTTTDETPERVISMPSNYG